MNKEMADLLNEALNQPLSPLRPQREANGYDVPATTLTTVRKKRFTAKYFTTLSKRKNDESAPDSVKLLMAGRADHWIPPPYSNIQRTQRLINSAAFDRASYDADGGDGWIDPRRSEFFQEPVGADSALWEKARQASKAAYGEVKWQFVLWWYRKQGGVFT